MSTAERKKLLGKSLLFFSLTFLPLMIGKLLIPMDWYSFRCWETMLDRHVCSPQHLGQNASFFYPNASCRRTEEGDLAGRSRYAVKRYSEWETDDLGFRNRKDSPDKKYDVVIVGDSDIVGTSLTQNDMLAPVLSKLVDGTCYSWAPDNINGFLQDERFQRKPPYVVVMADNQRNLRFWPVTRQLYVFRKKMMEIEREKGVTEPPSLFCKTYKKLPGPWQRYYADMLKKPWLTTHLAKLFWARFFGRGSEGSLLNEKEKMFFFRTALDIIKNMSRHPARMDEIAEAIQRYQQGFARKGILFIYVPIPAKESVYWELVPEKDRENLPRPAYLSALLENLRERGVPTVDLETVYRKEYQTSGKILYQSDDSHWNPEGVKIAAELLHKKIAELIK